MTQRTINSINDVGNKKNKNIKQTNKLPGRFQTGDERIGKVEFPVFNYLVQIVVTDDIVKSRNDRSHLIWHRYKENGLTLGLHSYNKEHSDCYLFLSPNADADTIAHECFHAIHRMFEWIHAEIEEEITAYHLGYLVGEVTKFINNQ